MLAEHFYAQALVASRELSLPVFLDVRFESLAKVFEGMFTPWGKNLTVEGAESKPKAV
jgi:hypothetical protein